MFTLAGNFRIFGRLRFLSHQETMRLWQRAIIRAGVRIKFSEGFNPHPELSLPLPRSVGVECANEMFCAGIQDDSQPDAGLLSARIAAELPAGCELLNLKVLPYKTDFKPCGAVYSFPVDFEKSGRSIEVRINDLNRALSSGESLMVERSGREKAGAKQVNIAPYILAVRKGDGYVEFECIISSAGTVRPEELLILLGLETGDLTGAIVRQKICWEEPRE